MMQFDLLFGLVLGVYILSHSDNLSKTLQTSKLSAADGQNIAELTCKTLERIRTDDSFKLFWEKVLRLQQSLGVGEPSLPRKRKVPKRFEVGTSEGFSLHTPEALFRVQYMEALDLVINFIRDRFNQPGYRIYCNLENLLPTKMTILLNFNLCLIIMVMILIVLFLEHTLNYLQLLLAQMRIIINLLCWTSNPM